MLSYLKQVVDLWTRRTSALSEFNLVLISPHLGPNQAVPLHCIHYPWKVVEKREVGVVCILVTPNSQVTPTNCYMSKSMGDRKDLCGTPQVSDHGADQKCLSFTNWV